ncbi:NADH-quinone oxidoreductase subunit NuoK [Rhodopseudomonas pseudopalustris]|uniref:NADH-quinone oxidoreductase subunit K n=2 Tax=Rhodopseudomonas TaxID=1073 RepID=NUOK_RHOPS|nr:NADH-quinone oxidoreductase subunit NuoK [Rhodopseudomonas pseudopalustris]Q13BG6.1 RecName: Full=NADH-quinone oxidoreductase subunit K; AltName: Full=NADH dehydrogenase I subunit K; AltName: Full=NDH-1 subunit K [Rhodopseudomonas palustris BisB5]ABE38573.1 NADH-ubiquinone oxidoreductase, chain 4L [Rhodopseudomonas palustris BisB5]SEO35222.1 NADH dehydrogenase subunit K [Rhodopseudomonas pseudopalustris]
MTGSDLIAMMILAAGLFAIGLFGVLARRGIMFQLVALEVALSGPALGFVAAGAYHADPQGQGMFILVLTLAAAEVAVGLALFLRIRRIAGSDDSDVISGMKG